jgi:hypothetical protein
VVFCFGRNWEEGDKEEIMKEGGRMRKLQHIFWGTFYKDTSVAENLGGQETTRIRGASKSKRMFLVGRKVNIQLGSLGKSKNK